MTQIRRFSQIQPCSLFPVQTDITVKNVQIRGSCKYEWNASRHLEPSLFETPLRACPSRAAEHVVDRDPILPTIGWIEPGGGR